jgi:hypothetical protein
MRKRKPIAEKVCKVSKGKVQHTNQKQSMYSKKAQILRELGEDTRQWELNFRLYTLTKMAKLKLI